jgi:hypothetical protein
VNILFGIALGCMGAAVLSLVYSWWCAWRRSRYEAVIHQEGRGPIDMEYYAGWSNHYQSRVQLFGDDVPVICMALGFISMLIGLLVWLAGKLGAQ